MRYLLPFPLQGHCPGIAVALQDASCICLGFFSPVPSAWEMCQGFQGLRMAGLHARRSISRPPPPVASAGEHMYCLEEEENRALVS